MSAYQKLMEPVRELYLLRSIEGLLDWDQETMLPKRGTVDRAEQIALLARLAHERLTSAELGARLEAAEAERAGEANPAIRANLREIRREAERARKIPAAVVTEHARVTSAAKEAWQQARRDDDFSAFAPHLDRILGLKRAIAEHVGYDTEPYDALLDEWEPGARAAEIAALFKPLEAALTTLLRAVTGAPRQPDVTILQRPWPIPDQREFGQMLAHSIGFDPAAGRLDVSTHPFCQGMTPRDVRLTTRYDERYAPMAMFGVLHEAGHGLYEQGLPVEDVFTPAGQAISMAIHESQSRLWENLVGRALPFWQHFYPRLQQAHGGLRETPLAAWHFAINAVRPSFIRVEADEVTYGLHIGLRFELERALLDRRLAVRDLPDAWNAGMQARLGVTPPTNREGCLQDIHWAMGAIGYFPTYQLGNLYAAQFLGAARRALPDLDRQLAGGEFAPLREWLRREIHAVGRRERAGDLVQRITGAPLDTAAFLDNLRQKYAALYGLDPWVT